MKSLPLAGDNGDWTVGMQEAACRVDLPAAVWDPHGPWLGQAGSNV